MPGLVSTLFQFILGIEILGLKVMLTQAGKWNSGFTMPDFFLSLPCVTYVLRCPARRMGSMHLSSNQLLVLFTSFSRQAAGLALYCCMAWQRSETDELF